MPPPPRRSLDTMDYVEARTRWVLDAINELTAGAKLAAHRHQQPSPQPARQQQRAVPARRSTVRRGRRRLPPHYATKPTYYNADDNETSMSALFRAAAETGAETSDGDNTAAIT